jgi:hypothetical protein
VVAAVVVPIQPDMTADRVLDLEAGVDELNLAVAAILRVAGLRPPEDAQGEARPVASPGAGPATSSAPSTAPSPPAASTPTR